MPSINATADAVRAEMARRRRTQADLAEALGMSQPSVHRRLAGEVEFSVSEIRIVAEWLGVSAAELVAA